MQEKIFKCNALISGRNSINVKSPVNRNMKSLVNRNVERFGNWIGGSVILRDDHLIFTTNAINAIYQQDASDLLVPYTAITACQIGRMVRFFKTVDLNTSAGDIRFRCWGTTNDTLLANLTKRLENMPDKAPTMIDQLQTVEHVPVSESISKIAAALAGQTFRVGIADQAAGADRDGEDQPLSLLVGHDADGTSWLYLYTSDAAMTRGGFPEGAACVTMPFEELFKLAQQQQFGGFIVDPVAGGDCLTLVPAEYFDEVAKALAD
jgi:SseB protein N-terminal domain